MTSSWIEIAEDSDFSLENIPFGVFSTREKLLPRCATAIGDTVVDLSILAESGMLDDIPNFSPRCFTQSTLNEFFTYPRPIWVAVRNTLIDLFSETNTSSDRLRINKALQAAALHDMKDVTMHLPADIGDYTDFYASREHATNVGTMFRGKDNALQPNWLHLPVGYHGRSSTIFVSGTTVRRPCGQLQKDRQDPKQGSIFGPCAKLDFELEMAFFVAGPPNRAGERLSVRQAYERIFGFCLMNDWSARDIQTWEYVPLGPFTAKNFATSISPWIVTTMALEDFVTPTSAKEQIEPIPLEYLQDPNYSSFNIALSVEIQSQDMEKPTTVSESNFSNLYWNATQQLVHHSVTGCIMRPGDLLGSGTISGCAEASFGSMLELSWNGTKEVSLGSSGEVRTFLHDGDTVIMKGWCQKGGHGRVGFGTCSGTILPALTGVGDIQVPAVTNERYQDFQLYSFWRSSCTYRVRIALAAKAVSYKTITVNIMKHENLDATLADLNPMHQVPVLEFKDTSTGETIQISQSIAIIEFLEEAFPKGPALLPADTTDRAKARQMVEIINSGIQPIQNLALLKDIETRSQGTISAAQIGKERITRGLKALEAIVVKQLATKYSKNFCMGGFAPTIVDACLAPQLFNAKVFGVDITEVCPTLEKIGTILACHPWFVGAHPDAQPDGGTWI